MRIHPSLSPAHIHCLLPPATRADYVFIPASPVRSRPANVSATTLRSLFIFKICPLMFFRYLISSYWCSCVVIFNQLKHLTNSGCRYTFQSRRKNGKRDFQGLWHISGHHLEFLFLFIAKLSHWHHF